MVVGHGPDEEPERALTETPRIPMPTIRPEDGRQIVQRHGQRRRIRSELRLLDREHPPARSTDIARAGDRCLG